MHSGNMGIPRSTANQTHGRVADVDGIRKGLWGHQGLCALRVNYKVPSINDQRPAPVYSRPLSISVLFKTIK